MWVLKLVLPDACAHLIPLYIGWFAGLNCGIPSGHNVRPTGLIIPCPLQPRHEAKGGGLRGWVLTLPSQSHVLSTRETAHSGTTPVPIKNLFWRSGEQHTIPPYITTFPDPIAESGLPSIFCRPDAVPFRVMRPPHNLYITTIARRLTPATSELTSDGVVNGAPFRPTLLVPRCKIR